MAADCLHCDVLALMLMGAFLLAAGRGEAQGDDPGRFLVRDREAFLRLLDLDRPELAAVKDALDAGDVEAAGAAYMAHFRAMAISPALITDWRHVPRNPDVDTARADGLLAGDFWDGYSVWQVPETGFDWHGSPLSCCTRFPVLPTLRDAAHHTRDPKYARFMVEHILGYMQAYPIAEFVGKSTDDGWTDHTTTAKPWYWCMIPERLMQLPQTVALLRDFPEVTDDELLAMLQRLYEEAGYLTTELGRWVERRHNGGAAMIKGLATTCALLQDFPATRAWLDYDARLLTQYLDEAFYPDGMCVELTTAYSASVSVMQQQLAYMLREQQPIRERRERLAKLVEVMVGLSDPTRRLPSFGDLYAGSLAGAVYRPLVRWLGMPWVETVLDDADGPEPPFLTWPPPGAEQWCGYYTMRSDWSADARFMMIDGGPWGTTHQHGDRLSFVVTAWGRRFIIDPSGTRYASNRPGAFIGGQPSGFLHNTITVDGVDEFHSEGTVAEVTEPLNNRWEQGPQHILFAADYSFRPLKPITWQRRVVFVDGSYWLLQDVLIGDQDAADLEQNFQFEADIEVELQGTMAIATASNGARLVLAPLEGGLQPAVTIGDRTPHTTYWPSGTSTTVLRSSNGYDQQHARGWTGRGSDTLMPAPAVTYAGRAELPVMLTVAIVPLAPGQAPDDLPDITRRTRDNETVWTLPTSEGALQLRTGLDGCSVFAEAAR